MMQRLKNAYGIMRVWLGRYVAELIEARERAINNDPLGHVVVGLMFGLSTFGATVLVIDYWRQVTLIVVAVLGYYAAKTTYRLHAEGVVAVPSPKNSKDATEELAESVARKTEQPSPSRDHSTDHYRSL